MTCKLIVYLRIVTQKIASQLDLTRHDAWWHDIVRIIIYIYTYTRIYNITNGSYWPNVCVFVCVLVLLYLVPAIARNIHRCGSFSRSVWGGAVPLSKPLRGRIMALRSNAHSNGLRRVDSCSFWYLLLTSARLIVFFVCMKWPTQNLNQRGSWKTLLSTSRGAKYWDKVCWCQLGSCWTILPSVCGTRKRTRGTELEHSLP